MKSHKTTLGPFLFVSFLDRFIKDSSAFSNRRD
jgi:hypothetical protein